MKLVSMKLDPKEQKKEADAMMVDKPLYPWGLCVELNEEAIDKLGIDELPDVDEEYTLTAHVVVTNVGDRKNATGRQRSLSLQIEAMGLSEPSADADEAGGKSKSSTLYGG